MEAAAVQVDPIRVLCSLLGTPFHPDYDDNDDDPDYGDNDDDPDYEDNHDDFH